MKPCPDTFPFPLVALDETASTNQPCEQTELARLASTASSLRTRGASSIGVPSTLIPPFSTSRFDR